MALAHEIVGDGSRDRTVIFAHGILGSRTNWKSFAKKLCDRVDDVRCVLVALRGHGESHSFSPPHTVDACVDDLIALGIEPRVVVGHSFGGKVMLSYAARPTVSVEQAWILDAPLGPRTF